MKIALLFPSWANVYGYFSYFAKRSSGFPPIGLAIIAAIAEKDGHDVIIIDGAAEELTMDQIIKETLAFKPDLVGITAATPLWHKAIELSQGIKAKNPNVLIAVGGPHITVLKEKAFDKCFDFGFIGQAELSWQMFLQKYQNKEDISGIQGILYRENGNVVFTGDSDKLMEFEKIPLPARHLLKNEKYKIGTPEGLQVFTGLETTRGCPYKCAFCTTKISGDKVRRRSPESVVNEMKKLIFEFGIRHFYIMDDTLTLNRKHILAICDLIEKEGLKITFEGQTRANLIDEKLMGILVNVGLIRLGFGFETSDLEIRKIIKKEIPLESYIEANRLANKYKIEVQNSAILGLPGETRITANKTINYLRKCREIHHINYSIAMPYPGTDLLEMAKKGEYGLKLLTDDFDKYLRYGNAVMEVNDLTAEDLIELQNKAYLITYLMPWRIIPILKRQGLMGLLLTYSRFFIMIKIKLKKIWLFSRFSKKIKK